MAFDTVPGTMLASVTVCCIPPPSLFTKYLPFRDDASGLAITADARIDNREQLMEDMAVHVSKQHLLSDSQLILRAYQQWGESCVNHLLGDFVFAIWDERLQSLFVARDHMGCKPLYFHCHAGLFVFASSATAVARVEAVEATLNEGRVADYLVEDLEGINKTCSWYKQIRRLPPAHSGYYRESGFVEKQYWVPRATDLSHLNTDEDFLQAFTAVYSEAVRVRLRCNTEPASMLSGGLDSSTIVALARDICVAEGRPPLKTLSAISDKGTDCPETRSVQAIVEQGGIDALRVSPSMLGDSAAALVAAFSSAEDPFDTRMTIPALMFFHASQAGATVVLDGVDGEQVMALPTGYISHLLRGRLWRTAWREARGFSRHYYRGYRSAWSLYVAALRASVTPDLLRSIRRRLQASLRYRRLLHGRMISRRFARRVNLPERLSELEYAALPGSPADLSAIYRHEVQLPGLVAGIERYERVASYFCVEARHPLLDKRVIEFCQGLPWQQRGRDGWSKFLLRQVAQQRLPGLVAWREGWEELGWVFTMRLARDIPASAQSRFEALIEGLYPYVDREMLIARYHGRGAADDDERNVEYRELYYFYQWLQRAGVNSAALISER